MINYIDKKNTYIDENVEIGDNCLIYPGVTIMGKTIIGNNCTIYPNSFIKDSIIGNNTTIYTSYIINSQLGNADNVKIGSFVEIKNCNISIDSKVPHLAYLGDTQIGKNCNIGCGVITANFDGKRKNETNISDNVFIGCSSTLVAPINIGENVFIAAGSTITDNIPNNNFSIARSKQETKLRKHTSSI